MALWHMCGSKPDMNLFNALIKAGAPIRYEDQKYPKYNVLCRAASQGFVDSVKALVDADPDPAHLNKKVSVP